jgi:hypothetical protein
MMLIALTVINKFQQTNKYENMKKIFLLAAILLCCVFSNAQYVVEKNPMVITFKEKLFDHSSQERGKQYYNLPVCKNRNQTVILLLPLKGTTSYATLYKREDYEQNKEKKDVLEYLRKRTDAKSIPDGQPLTLNLTSLEDGEYIVICHTDVVFPPISLSISTKR